MEFERMQREVHRVAVDRGWYSNGDPGFGNFISNVHAEVSEAFEEYRLGNEGVYFTADGSPEGTVAELADVVIRIMDYCEYKGHDLNNAIIAKHNYNKTRSYRHGDKKV